MTDEGRGRPGDGRRPTKTERREQARREREELQRRMASKRRARTVGIAVGAVVVAAVAAAVTLLPSGGDFPEPGCSFSEPRTPPPPRGAPRCRRPPTTNPRRTTGPISTTGQHRTALVVSHEPARVRAARRRATAGRRVRLPDPAAALPVDPLARARSDHHLVRPRSAGRTDRTPDRVLRSSLAGRAGRPGSRDRRPVRLPGRRRRDPSGRHPDGGRRVASSPHCARASTSPWRSTSRRSTALPTALDRDYAGVAPEAGAAIG